ncbi:MAG: hypothetical protein ACJA0Q_000580 [Saprospiraceae bacterium]|jgi:hypothetical protein
MELSEFKNLLQGKEQLLIELPNGNLVPSHFHVTEVGLTSKIFIDCGGVPRQEQKINFQLWEANDYDHRLHPKKLSDIIKLSITKLNLPDAEIEVEYQGSTIQKFGIEHSNGKFQLVNLHTDCLARDNCGVPEHKSPQQKIQLINFGDLEKQETSCTPDGGCC